MSRPETESKGDRERDEHRQATLGRVPTDEEVAAHMGIDVICTDAGYQKWPSTVSLDMALAGDGRGCMHAYSTLDDTNSPDPVSITSRRSLIDALIEAIEKLSDREKLLSLYYKEEAHNAEISEVMGISNPGLANYTRAILSCALNCDYG